MSLPAIIPFHGDWPEYEDEIYQIYRDEVVNGGLSYNNLPVRCRYRPPSRGKGYGFWKIIEGDPDDPSRLPEIDRCERISWIAWIITHVKKDPRISFWVERNRSSTDIMLWIEKEDYLVILSRRSGYYLLTTAYCITNEHKRRKLRRKREEYWKAQKG